MKVCIYLYIGQKMDKGNSQPGACGSNWEQYLEKNCHLSFVWQLFIKFHSAGTIAVVCTSSVIIPSVILECNMPRRKKLMDPTICSSVLERPAESEKSMLSIPLTAALTYAWYRQESNGRHKKRSAIILKPPSGSEISIPSVETVSICAFADQHQDNR
jgi:hypothetical protein